MGAGFRAVAHVVPRQGSGRSASEPIIAEVKQRVPRRWPAEDVLRPSFRSPREYYTRTWWRFFNTVDPNPRLQLLSVLHYGFGQDEYWSTRQNPQYTAPEVLERRISDVIKPLLSNIRADGRPNAPDYVEFAPGTWDLARWAEQDVAAQRNTNEPLSPDRLAWFRNRLAATGNRLQAAFLTASTKIWRTMYFPFDHKAEIDYFLVRQAVLRCLFARTID